MELTINVTSLVYHTTLYTRCIIVHGYLPQIYYKLVEKVTMVTDLKKLLFYSVVIGDVTIILAPCCRLFNLLQ